LRVRVRSCSRAVRLWRRFAPASSRPEASIAYAQWIAAGSFPFLPLRRRRGGERAAGVSRLFWWYIAPGKYEERKCLDMDIRKLPDIAINIHMWILVSNNGNLFLTST
jgi:hypothetical protein